MTREAPLSCLSRRRLRGAPGRGVRVGLTIAGLLPLGGCYYGHLAEGQLVMLWERRPLEEASRDPDLAPRTRTLLGLVDDVRRDARQLGLAVDGQYTSYVDWPGDRVVTTLVRTHAGTLDTAPWWFPFVGRLPYKGYFDRDRAEAEAEAILQAGEYDVCVSGVAAYSTLGWLDDPVTQPMLRRGAAPFVETLFHELVHATAFLPGEADFNEGVAQFIGQQAAIRFFTRHRQPARDPLEGGIPAANDPPAPALDAPWPDAERVRASIADRQAVARRLLDLKQEIEALDGAPDRDARRAEAEARARRDLAAMPLATIDPSRVAERARLSDACLALRGAYVGDADRHALVLAALDGDLSAMIDRLRRWADESLDPEAFFEVARPALSVR